MKIHPIAFEFFCSQTAVKTVGLPLSRAVVELGSKLSTTRGTALHDCLAVSIAYCVSLVLTERRDSNIHANNGVLIDCVCMRVC